MAFRFSLPLHGFKGHNGARTMLSPSVYCHTPTEVIRKFQMIKRLARQNGTLRRTFQLQRREKPCDRRKWNLMDRAYFRKWHHLKYCTQVIKYSIENGLSFINSVEDESFRPVASENFGSGRLLRHHLEEVRIDPSDKHKQPLNFQAMADKYENSADLLRYCWKWLLQEVRKHPQKGMITLLELRREALWSQPITYTDDFRDSIRKVLHRPEKESDIIKTQTNLKMTMDALAKYAGDELKKLFPISVQLQAVEYWEKDMKSEDKIKRKIYLQGDRAIYTEEEWTKWEFEGEAKNTLLRHAFRSMELVGARGGDAILDTSRAVDEMNKRQARRSQDRAYSLEQLRALAHGSSGSAREASITK